MQATRSGEQRTFHPLQFKRGAEFTEGAEIVQGEQRLNGPSLSPPFQPPIPRQRNARRAQAGAERAHAVGALDAIEPLARLPAVVPNLAVEVVAQAGREPSIWLRDDPRVSQNRISSEATGKENRQHVRLLQTTRGQVQPAFRTIPLTATLSCASCVWRYRTVVDRLL